MSINVPTYRERQVTQSGAPNAQQRIDAPSEAFGSATAQATQNLGNAGQDVSNIIQKRALTLQEERNKAKVLEAQQQLMDWQVEYLHNPEQGAYTKRGGNAMDVTRTTVKSYEEQGGRIAENLENDRQREMFRQLSLQNREQLFEQVSKFERDELYRYGQASREGMINSLQQGATASAQNPQISENYYKMMEQVWMSDPTIPKENIPTMIAIERSKNILTGMKANYDTGNLEGVLDMFNTYGENITGPDAAQASLLAQKAERTLNVNSIAPQIIAQSTNSAEAVRMAREFEGQNDAGGNPIDKDFVDDLVTEVKRLDGERKLQVDHDKNQAIMQAWNQIDAGGGIESIPAWADRSTQSAMRKYIADKANGTEVETDPKAWANVKRMYLETPGKFATADISADLVKLGPVERRKALQWKADLQAGIDENLIQENRKALLTASEIEREGKHVLRQVMGEGWMSNRKNIDKRDKFLYELDRKIELEQERQGIDGFDRNQINVWAEELLQEGEVSKDWWLDPNKRYFELTDDEKEKFYIPYDDIPKSDKLRIRQEIKMRNSQLASAGARDLQIPETSAGVERVFNAKKFGRDIFQPGFNE